jgi:uncharacterized NAD(P)/FAD-binding protein YdhS
MEIADIAIIGSGISCTSTLIDVFRRLINDVPVQKKLSITVMEKNQEFWFGIPYGSRSSINALTITSVYDFFTAEKERNSFFEWFKTYEDELLDYYLQNGGLTAQKWFKRNNTALQNLDYKNLYLPRFMCGRYLQSKFNSLLKIVEDSQLAQLTLIHAEAIDVEVTDGLYTIILEDEANNLTKITAAKVIIATGSGPVIDITQHIDGVIFINNLYEPSVDDNIKILTAALAAVNNPADRNILMVGTNASSMEFLYLMAGLPELSTQINQLVAVSRSGLFPYHIINKALDSYPTENLDRLKVEGNYTINTLVNAATKDIKTAVKDGVVVPYIDKVIGFTMELLQALDEDAKKQFMGIYGMQLSNQFRRSGTDYKGGETLLLEIQKLTVLKGSFVSIEQGDRAGLLRYIDSETQIQQTYGAPLKVIINCTGANDLDKSSGRLIYNLVHKNIAQVNLSGKGFYVNERFEAAPNLYIMGPLLGGNMNARIHFWHLENASRIMYLSPFLAECLVG